MNQIVKQIKSKYRLSGYKEEEKQVELDEENEKFCEDSSNNDLESETIKFHKKFNELFVDGKDGICPDCKQLNTGHAWCSKCDPGRFLREGNTSGNAEIDKFLHEAQLRATSYYESLEWISFDRLADIKPIGEGGFANVYSATWLDGKPELNRKKERSAPITVALKKLKNLNNITEAFINEVIEH